MDFWGTTFLKYGTKGSLYDSKSKVHFFKKVWKSLADDVKVFLLRGTNLRFYESRSKKENMLMKVRKTNVETMGFDLTTPGMAVSLATHRGLEIKLR